MEISNIPPSTVKAIDLKSLKNIMKIINAEQVFSITDFPRTGERFDSNEQPARDMRNYEAIIFSCPGCNEKIAFKENDFFKHIDIDKTNLSEQDSRAIEKTAKSITKSAPCFLDFYCPKCKAPLRIYYTAYVAGKGEMFYSLKHVAFGINK